MSDRESFPRSGPPPFFVVGCGRSGTTLLQSLLSAHSRIAVTPETHFMKRAEREGARTRAAPLDFDAFWRGLVAWSRFRELGVEADDVRARIEAAGRHDFQTVFAAMLEAYGERTGKPRVGEKTPGHYRHLDMIFDWFPDARVVAIRRDPRDMVASHLGAPWVTEEMAPGRLRAPVIRRLRAFHVAERARIWRQTNGVILAEAEADSRVHMVVYEDLVAAPDRELRRICDFLGETFEPGMLAPRDDAHTMPVATDDRIRARWESWNDMHHARANAPVSVRSVGRWREKLSPSEAALIEAICGTVMTRYGYDPEMPRSPRRLFGQALLQAGLVEDEARRLAARGKALLGGYRSPVRASRRP